MNNLRKLAVIALLFLLAFSTIAIYAYFHRRAPAKVGIYLYVWYGALEDDWTNTTKFSDFPISDLGNYSSLNKTVVQKQLDLIEGLSVDFVVISWWGNGENDTYGKFIDDATRLVFQTAQEERVNLKFAVMVEPYLKSDASYDYAGIYDYVYDEFAARFPGIYYNVENKPLICFFNDDPEKEFGLTPSGYVPGDSRFTKVLVGNESYTDWTYLSNVVRKGQASMFPRYDSYQSPDSSIDVDLSEGHYDTRWQKAIQLWKEGTINTITIASWNEYPERTEIEPHIDKDYDETTYNNATYYLYNKTFDYIRQVHG